MDEEKWSCHRAVNFRSLLCCAFVTHDLREIDNFLGTTICRAIGGVRESRRVGAVYPQLPSCARLGRARGARPHTGKTADANRLGGVAAPVGDLFQTFSAGMLEESDFVAGVFEFVDVSPDFRLPRCLMGRSLAATGAAGVKGDAWLWRSLDVLQFEKDAAHFFDLFVRAHDVLVAQKVSKAEFAGFDFRFFAGVERAVFGSQLLGRVARHPENVFVSHAYLSLGLN